LQAAVILDLLMRYWHSKVTESWKYTGLMLPMTTPLQIFVHEHVTGERYYVPPFPHTIQPVPLAPFPLAVRKRGNYSRL
jgi:hypothetical protein